MEKSNAPAFKTVTATMLIMFTGKLLGVLRERIHGAYFGADSIEGIAFMQASFLPRTFLDIMFASVFSASFIPVFNAYLETKSKKAAYDLAALFISVTLALTTAVTLLCMLAAPRIFAVFLDGAGLSPEARSLTVNLLRVMFPLMILSGLAFSITGVVQSLGQFSLPAAMSIVSNGIILVYYFFFLDRFGMYGLCAAFLLGWAAQTLIQIPYLVKQKFRFRFRFALKDPGLKQMAALALPVMVASWLGPVNLMVNNKASVNLYGAEFGVTAIQYANNLYTIVSGVFVLSVANIIFPQLSKQTAAGDMDGFKDGLGETLRSLFFLLLPMSLGLAAVSEPLVQLVYQTGLFGERAVEITSAALRFFSPGILGYGLQIILSRACYALRDGRTPLYAAAAAMVINAVLSFALAPVMEVAGPALASTVSISTAAGWMLIVLAKRGYAAWLRGMTADLVKMLGMSLVMWVAVVFIRDRLDGWVNGPAGRLLAVGLPVAAGAAVYFTGCFILKVEAVKQAVRLLRPGKNMR